MIDVPAKNAPMLAGWAMAAGFGAAAAGVGYVALSLGGMGAAFVGGVIFAGTGLVLGVPLRELPGPGAVALPMDPVPDRTAPEAVMAAAAPAAPEGVAASSIAPVAEPAPAAAAAPEPAPAPTAASEPAPLHAAAAEMPAPAVAATAVRPAGLAAAREGKADDLKIIKGIGPKLEELCHRLGYYHFDQIAGWSEAEVAWVDENLEGFKGRVTRDRWVPQAKAILAQGKDEFLRRLDAGEAF